MPVTSELGGQAINTGKRLRAGRRLFLAHRNCELDLCLLNQASCSCLLQGADALGGARVPHMPLDTSHDSGQCTTWGQDHSVPHTPTETATLTHWSLQPSKNILKPPEGLSTLLLAPVLQVLFRGLEDVAPGLLNPQDSSRGWMVVAAQQPAMPPQGHHARSNAKDTVSHIIG